MQKLLRYLFFVTVVLGGVLVGSHQYSRELTTQFFYNAFGDEFGRCRDVSLCMSMLDNPAVVSKIDFNMPWRNGRENALQLAITRECNDLVLKIFNLKKDNGDFVIDLNYKNFFEDTVLHQLAQGNSTFCKDMIAQILDRKDTQGNPIVNVDAVDKYGMTPLMYTRGEMVDVFLKFKANINAKDHFGYTALIMNAFYHNFVGIKKLLVSGADVTPKITRGGNVGQDFLDILRRRDCDYDPKIKKMIFAIYDTLKPDLIKKELSLHEQDVVQAYDEFLHGRHDELRNLLLVLPDIMRRKRINIDPFIEPIRTVFKRDSIKQLLLFLAEKKYQQNMAHYIIESSSLKKEQCETGMSSDEKLGWQSSSLKKEQCEMSTYSDEKPRTCSCCSLM